MKCQNLSCDPEVFAFTLPSFLQVLETAYDQPGRQHEKRKAENSTQKQQRILHSEGAPYFSLPTSYFHRSLLFFRPLVLIQIGVPSNPNAARI